MLLLAFLTAATVLSLLLGFLVQFKSYRTSLRVALLGLSGLYGAHLWVGWLAVFSPDPDRWYSLHRVLLGMGLVAAVALLEPARRFLRGGEHEPVLLLHRGRVAYFWLAAGAALLGVVVLLVPGAVTLLVEDGRPQLAFDGVGVLLPSVRVLLAVYGLYLLENTYRFAQDYQRRIGRLVFIGLGVIFVQQLILYSMALLYGRLPQNFAESSSVVYGVVYPVVLLGFLRYRLGSEKITVPREAVYTSATVFLIGAAFLGVSITVLAFQWLKLDFAWFERFLLGFSLCFLAVLVLGSGTMRRRISRFVDRQFYSRKYDYQEQFFRLHKAGLSGSDVRSTTTELVENMKYSVMVDDAHFFLLDGQDGNFHQQENKEEATRRGLVIAGDGALARRLARDKLPIDLLDATAHFAEARLEVKADPMVALLGSDAVFPVFVGDRLGGILLLKGGLSRPFDAEDLALIAVFTDAIGDALFKNRVVKERIEQKQFESFHHVASFIIHDIKNQVATLNLIMKNAERNMANPAFQASMMSSIRSCTENLQGLISRLSVAPRKLDAAMAPHPLGPLLEETVSNSGLASMAGIDLTFSPDDCGAVPMDREALFFVVRNLVNNAVEAMGGRGRLGLSCGSMRQGVPPRLQELFGRGERFLAGFQAWILVEDSGPGMDKEFLRTRLFQPFATTKEKGVGIGLYQCRTLVERMGGRILCHSEPGQGTEFCILLAGTAPAGPSLRP